MHTAISRRLSADMECAHAQLTILHIFFIHDSFVFVRTAELPSRRRGRSRFPLLYLFQFSVFVVYSCPIKLHSNAFIVKTPPTRERHTHHQTAAHLYYVYGCKTIDYIILSVYFQNAESDQAHFKWANVPGDWWKTEPRTADGGGANAIQCLRVCMNELEEMQRNVHTGTELQTWNGAKEY